jgi:hypothetical protein
MTGSLAFNGAAGGTSQVAHMHEAMIKWAYRSRIGIAHDQMIEGSLNSQTTSNIPQKLAPVVRI